ncbi:MAG: Flp pilus assembly complex ATPase component TadA, partial [Lachnospiraceae bacterium]|nr:Flp pilus assembly complex ATPase component TadA [Lachnospiraceae bacterium]
MADNVRQRIDLSREVDDTEIREMIDDLLVQNGRKYALSLAQRQQLGRSVFHSIRKMDVLQELVDCDDVTEIMVNGTENIFVEKGGRIYEWDKRFETREKLENVIQQIVAKCNRVVNEASPIADARLENGSRVNIVLSPVALNGPILTIRRFPDHPISMENLIGFGSITREAAEFLKQLVIAGYNIFISGGTGSGKTTFLNALSYYIPKTDRVITIEDSAELQLQGIPNLVRLETRNANMDG